MRKIIWSDYSEIDYEENISYLIKEWSISEALNFVESTENCLGIIVNSPEIFPDKRGDGFRSVVVVPQITLFYKIHNNHIRLHRFWNNYKNPINLKY